ncbi:MAG: hypothetical protein WAT92_10905 [Saprospiraceae bacterium]|nr:hypothetical protein [Saprospiraceae bacterium]
MTPRNRLVAAIFAMVGGTVGLHKFYLRDGGGSVLFIFLMFFSLVVGFPFTFFLGLFHGFKLLGMSDEEFDKKYNRGFIQRNPQIERRREEQMRRYEKVDSDRGFVRPPSKVRNNPFKTTGMSKYKDYDLESAIEDFKQGLNLEPNDIALNFNIACAYSLTEKKSLAFEHLAKAVNLGFNDLDRILKHDDLAYMRIQPEFEEFKRNEFKVVPRQIQNEAKPKAAESQPEGEVFKLEQLKKLESLKDRGILSEIEYQKEKQRLTR